MKRLGLFLAMLASASSAWCEMPSPTAVVEAFVAAFNAHDAEAMAEWVSDEVAWYGIDGGTISTEIQGRAALEAGMSEYFEGTPSVASGIEALSISGGYAVFRERVSWGPADNRRTQSALAVYRIDDGRIRAVWYFPAEP